MQRARRRFSDAAALRLVFCTMSNIQKDRFYDLRHTCASLLIAQDVHARVIMDLLGHSDIGVTMNTYAHVMQASKDEAARRMQELLNPPDK